MSQIPSATPGKTPTRREKDARRAIAEEDCQRLRVEINRMLTTLDGNVDSFLGVDNKAEMRKLIHGYARLSKRVGRSREMVLESDLLSRILRLVQRSFNSIGGQWDLDNFVTRYGRKLHGEQEEGEDAPPIDLRTISEATMRDVDRVFTMPIGAHEAHLNGMSDCLFGQIDLEREPAERTERRKRQRVKLAEEKIIKAESTDKQSKEERETAQNVEKLRSAIVKLYKKLGQRPISYWSLIVDADSFENSLHNFFHSLYLFRDGLIRVSFDDDGWPLIEPDKRSAEEKQGEQGTSAGGSDIHWMPSFSMQKWRQYIDVFKISSSQSNDK